MTMPTKRDISSFFRRFWPQVLGIATIIALITRIEWLSNVIRQRLSEGMVPEPAGVLYQGNYLLSAQWGWSLAIFIVLLTAGVYVVISSRIGAKEEPTSSELESELSLLQRVRRNSVNNMSLIVNQMYKRRPVYKIEIFRCEIHINREGDGEVSLHYRIRADREPLDFFVVALNAEGDAAPVQYLEEIGFKIKDIDRATSVTHQLFKDGPREKRLAIFFLPRVEPDQTRSLDVSFKWPAMCRRLIGGGEEFGWGFESQGVIDELVYDIFVEPTVGSFTSTISGNKHGIQEINRMFSKRDWPGFRYTVKNAAAEGPAYAVRLDRT